MADNVTVFSARAFHFKLGGPPQSFHLHTQLVTKHSPFLATLMTGPMREAQDRTATIHDVEVDSFTRFAEYIYGGDYNAVQHTVKTKERDHPQDDYSIPEPSVEQPLDDYSFPEPSVEQPQDDSIIPEPPVEHNDWSTWGMDAIKKSKKVRKATSKFPKPTTLLSLADYPVVIPVTGVFPVITRDTFLGIELAEDCDTECDFTEVLLCHARVYCMADRFQVPRLKELAIYKLCILLRHILNSSHCYVGNLVSLLDYVYSHTMDLESTRETLRDLLAHYVAWDFRSCMGEADFKAFLVENGAFARDVCEKVSMRL